MGTQKFGRQAGGIRRSEHSNANLTPLRVIARHRNKDDRAAGDVGATLGALFAIVVGVLFVYAVFREEIEEILRGLFLLIALAAAIAVVVAIIWFANREG